MKLSKNDWAIIKKLTEDSRTTCPKIGQEIGVSGVAVYLRIAKMLEEGVIKKFTIEINPKTLGRNILGFLLVDTQPGSLEDVATSLTKNEQVLEIYETHGPHTLIVKAATADTEEMRTLVTHIRNVKGVTSTELATSHKIWK